MSAAQSLPALAHRGLMIDMAREKERDEYYFDLLDQLALFGYNALYLHFTDNEGCAIQLRSYPQFSTPYAMSQKTLAQLIAAGNERGIEIIPEIESWGHARWILAHFPALGDPVMPKITLALGNEAVYPILDAVIGEVAELFPGRYIHLGFDEAWWGEQKPPNDGSEEVDLAIAAHTNRVCTSVFHRGKTPMLWDDMVVRRPRVLARIDKRVVMVNWEYWTDVTGERAKRLSTAGFAVVTGPALMWAACRVLPGPDNLENVRRMTGIAHDQHLMGTVTTVWLPQRYVPGVLPHAIAYAGRCMRDPSATDVAGAMAEFVSRYFGTDDQEIVAAFVQLSGIDNLAQDLDAAFWRTPEHFETRLKPEFRARDQAFAVAVAGLRGILARRADQVRRHQTDYQAYVLLGGVLEYLAARRNLPAAIQVALGSATDSLAGGRRQAAADRLRAVVAQMDSLERQRHALVAQLDCHWDSYRYSDDPLKRSGGTSSLMWYLTSEETNGYGSAFLRGALADMTDNVQNGGERVWPLRLP